LKFYSLSIVSFQTNSLFITFSLSLRIVGKQTWIGCGLHIDSALSGIAMEKRCDGWKKGECTNKKKGGAGVGDAASTAPAAAEDGTNNCTTV
jgi:hypothetical protein